jgi:hypothetical protein
MFLIDTHVAELAAGYEVICEFLATLESTWLPGFDRSYHRRQDEYRKALQKHEERGLFLRTLLKTPKPPNRPPPRFKEEVSARLHDEWTASFTTARPSHDSELLDLLSETLDDSFYTIPRLQLHPNLTAPALVLASPAQFLFVETDQSPEPSQTSPQQIWQQTAVAISDLIHQADLPGLPAETPINGGIFIPKNSSILPQETDLTATIPAAGADFWQHWLAENTKQTIYNQKTLFAITDTLLSHHQELTNAHTFSALTTAEKLTKREKDNLLRMAATL